MIAEALEAIGGVPAKILADRMGCLKGGVVAKVVVPTSDYVRFASWPDPVNWSTANESRSLVGTGGSVAGWRLVAQR